MTWDSNLAITRANPTASGRESRSFRDGAFSIKLLALIDQVYFGFVDSLAGTGRSRLLRANDAVMGQKDVELIVDSAEGWVFAFEGGAHILFRHTLKNPKFVIPEH